MNSKREGKDEEIDKSGGICEDSDGKELFMKYITRTVTSRALYGHRRNNPITSQNITYVACIKIRLR